ncbi:MAG: 4-hydroxy-3-methylbut-2-enyl diphosphate reductase [Bacteroidales bacterium]|nr:4-hydroxy-3-methylbut-2-enyl diphosphate reductase [Bacteroidales bacterium]MDD3273526.1 4-hydroxy-3-methylbut-2-enyl diphosphate reductase [Bacteroidales bacterium]
MKISIDIDTHSGFCYGVVRAIEQAEKYLEKSSELHSLGSIVHNNTEISRLKEKGLKTIDYKQMSAMKDSVVFIRAHGEPPSSYRLAEENNLKIIDCTCPVVLKLQERVKNNYRDLKTINGQLVIFGKVGHAEVNGLVGQVDGDATVIEAIDDIERLDFSRPIYIFSQTTKDPEIYKQVCNAIRSRIVDQNGPVDKFKIFNTTCGQVSSRHPRLKEFSKDHSIIIFVSGRESSNGKILFDVCLRENPRSYKIETTEEIELSWFKEGDSVGICGATSTPKWLLEDVAHYLRQLFP